MVADRLLGDDHRAVHHLGDQFRDDVARAFVLAARLGHPALLDDLVEQAGVQFDRLARLSGAACRFEDRAIILVLLRVLAQAVQLFGIAQHLVEDVFELVVAGQLVAQVGQLAARLQQPFQRRHLLHHGFRDGSRPSRGTAAARRIRRLPRQVVLDAEAGDRRDAVQHFVEVVGVDADELAVLQALLAAPPDRCRSRPARPPRRAVPCSRWRRRSRRRRSSARAARALSASVSARFRSWAWRLLGKVGRGPDYLSAPKGSRRPHGLRRGRDVFFAWPGLGARGAGRGSRPAPAPLRPGCCAAAWPAPGPRYARCRSGCSSRSGRPAPCWSRAGR
jgi:hypothetical protein